MINIILKTYLLTYLSPWFLLEHRPCTKSLQRLLSWAILSSCFQLSPVCVMSASRSRRQVFFGLPLFLSPWGFHVNACLVMLVFGFLNVWPSHLHLLLRMSIYIWTWLVLSQRSLLLTLSIHCIPNIFRKHRFTKFWILFSVVLFIRQVSAPYSNTDLTFVLNKRIFVVLPITLDFHTFLKMWNAAPALPILVFTSDSVPPRVSTILPRYLNDSTSSIPSPFSMIRLWKHICSLCTKARNYQTRIEQTFVGKLNLQAKLSFCLTYTKERM